MTGPEHYEEAERLMRLANLHPDNFPSDNFAQVMAEAQVHATLAHTAATADLFALYGQVGDESKEAWRKAVAP
jgi:hypothetical protein